MPAEQLPIFFKILLVIACGFGAPAYAKVTACRLTQTITVIGQTIISDQCLENNGLNPVEFKEVCDFGKAGVPGLSIAPLIPVYVTTCPSQAISACENFAQGKYSSYVYGKDNVATPADRKIGCEKIGGRFR